MNQRRLKIEGDIFRVQYGQLLGEVGLRQLGMGQNSIELNPTDIFIQRLKYEN